MPLSQILYEQKVGDNAHDRLVLDVYRRLARTRKGGRFFFGATYQEGETVGEADLLLEEGNYILNLEMKVSYNSKTRKNAIKQLRKTEEVINSYFPGKYRIFNIAVFSNPTLRYEWIRDTK